MSQMLTAAALSALQPPYRLAVRLKNFAYGSSLLRPRSLHWPVISVGNLSAGGAGKTPIVIELARLLTAQGYAVDVLSRGYGRRSSIAVEQVEPQGDAQRFGDEPLLITQATGVPVFVGASRLAAGQLAERSLTYPGIQSVHPRLHLLDDGFQHRQLARTVDLVVLHPRDLNDRLLPVGRLREPAAALSRASAFLVREDDTDSPARLTAMGLEQPVWRVRRSLTVPDDVQGPAFAFCGIAHPSDFFAALGQHLVPLAGSLAFSDHHLFTPQDCTRILSAARSVAARSLLTTEKDFVRLSTSFKAQLSHFATLFSVPLRVSFLDEPTCLAQLLRLLSAPTR